EQLLALYAEYAAGRGPDWLTRKQFANGSFVIHAAEHVAYRDGDAATRAALEAKWQREHEASIAYGKMLGDRIRGGEDKRYDAPDVTGNETLTGEIIPPTDARRLAALARRLITENDPDAIRAGLSEIATSLESMGHT